MTHHHHKHRGRQRHKFLLVSFIDILEGRLTVQIFSNDTKGLNLTIQEVLQATGQIFPSAGPFQVDVTDPGNAITVTPGSADQATPTNFKPNGSGAVGAVTVKVTDQSNGLVGSNTFDVVAPAAAKPDTLVVGFVTAP
jgi:hypothetical protein